MDLSKQNLAAVGLRLVGRFLSNNQYSPPKYEFTERKQLRGGACGYFDPRSGERGKVVVSVFACAHRNPKFSWPGFISDRTPLGVLAHETGHFIDYQCNNAAYRIHRVTREGAITSYAPNSAEWFAEMMRLFITNPGLLKLIRPRTYHEIRKGLRLEPAVTEDWRKVMSGADAPVAVLARINRFLPR